MSFAAGRRSPPRSDGRNSPMKSIVTNRGPTKTFSKNDLLMSSPIPIAKSRSNPNSPKAEPSISEAQKVYLQSLNGQINHLESEFNDLLAVKDAVDHAKVHTGEEFNEEKAMLLEKKEQEYLQLRKDRSSALFNLASEIKMLIDASPNHTAPPPMSRTPVRQGTSLDFNHDSFSSSTANTPLKLSELSALASSDAGVHSRTVERILSKQNLNDEGAPLGSADAVASGAQSAAIVPSSSSTSFVPSFVSFPPQVYKPLDNKYLISGGQDTPVGPTTVSLVIPHATEVASPTTSDDDSRATAGPTAASGLPAARFAPLNPGLGGPGDGGNNNRPASAGPAASSVQVPAPPSQGVYAANPVPLHATRSSNNLTNAGIHHSNQANSSAPAAPMQFSSSFGGGSQPAAPIFQFPSVGGPGGAGGNVTSFSQGPSVNYNYPSSSAGAHGVRPPQGGRSQQQQHPHLHQHHQHYQEHVYSSPPPPPPPPQYQQQQQHQLYAEPPEPEEPPRFSNDEITKMLDHSNATTQQYLTLLQTQMKSLEIKQQTSENALLLRLAAVEKRLETLEGQHQEAVAAHQETVSRMVPLEEFQALRSTVETLTDAFLKVQKQVSATQAQTAANVHKSLGMRIMNGISNNLQASGHGEAVAPVFDGNSVNASATGMEDANSVAPVQELSMRLEQLERTLIQERDAANRAMHDMMIQHQQQNRLEALEHRKEILELMKSNRNHNGPEYYPSGGSSPAKSVHSAPATVGSSSSSSRTGHQQSSGGYHTEMATLRERRKELLNNNTVTPIKPLHVDASEIHELDVPYSAAGPSGGSNSAGYNPQVPYYSDNPSLVNPDLFHHQTLNPDVIRVRPSAAGYLRSIKAVPPLPQLPLLPSESSTPVNAAHSEPVVNDAMYYFNHVASNAVAASVAQGFGNSRSASPALTSSSSHARTSRSTTPTNIGRGRSAGAMEDDPQFKPVVPEYHYETLLQTNSRLFPTFPNGIAGSATPSGPVQSRPRESKKPVEDNKHQSMTSQQSSAPQTLQPHNIKPMAPFMQPTSSHQIKLWSKK